MFRYETHTHSSEASACATNDVVKMLEQYQKMNYTGIILTNHFFNGNNCIPASLKWEQRVELFCYPYEKAKIKGKELGIDVFFGWEYNYFTTEFLTYGLDKQFLLDHPEILDLSLNEYSDLVHQNNGFLVHAHPFRERWYINEIRLLPEITDAVEVLNGAQISETFNKKADYYANKHNFPKTAGSDSHCIDHYAFCGMEFDHKLKDIQDYIQSVKSLENSLFVI